MAGFGEPIGDKRRERVIDQKPESAAPRLALAKRLCSVVQCFLDVFRLDIGVASAAAGRQRNGEGWIVTIRAYAEPQVERLASTVAFPADMPEVVIGLDALRAVTAHAGYGGVGRRYVIRLV